MHLHGETHSKHTETEMVNKMSHQK